MACCSEAGNHRLPKKQACSSAAGVCKVRQAAVHKDKMTGAMQLHSQPDRQAHCSRSYVMQSNSKVRLLPHTHPIGPSIS
jgi:hypothetical protein